MVAEEAVDEGGRFLPAVSLARGRAPRFSWIYRAPASCLLKSALGLFLKKANYRRQRELFVAIRMQISNSFCFGAILRDVDAPRRLLPLPVTCQLRFAIPV
jgi:hypothetical protein